MSMTNEDEMICRQLQTASYDIPESYYQKVEKVLSDIEQGNVSHKKKGILANRYVKVAVIVLTFVLVSGTTYAAVNLYQQRMNSMSEEEMKQYNDDVQKLQVNVDGFSRALTEKEDSDMMRLRVQYEEENKFPANQIKQVEYKLDTGCDYVYFASSDSTFYIPDRELTEEELLEIIDLQEKRDYSVRNQNSAVSEDEIEDLPSNDSIPEEENYLTKVANIYGLDESKLNVISESVQENIIESVIAGYDMEFTVYYSEANGLYRIMVSKGGGLEHSSWNKLKKEDISKIKQCIHDKVPLFADQEIEKMEMYYLADNDDNMVSGTVSVYCYMADGKGCVAVYSLVYKDIYDIYVLNDTDNFSDMIKQKKKSAQSNDNKYLKL